MVCEPRSDGWNKRQITKNATCYLSNEQIICYTVSL